MDLTAEEARVLGALLEKSLTRPDDYPLTLNALVAACNQTTNRDPVVHYDELTVERALSGLRDKQLARRGVYAGSRVPKHRHAADETFTVTPAEQAVLAVLLLRGPQTLGELKARSERLFAFAGTDEVDATVDALSARVEPLVQRVARQPGQKEGRIAHQLGGQTPSPPDLVAEGARMTPVVPIARALDPGAEAFYDDGAADDADGWARIDALEAEVVALRREVAELREAVQQMYDARLD